MVQITTKPLVPSPELIVNPVRYGRNSKSVSLNVTLAESNKAGIMHSLNITMQDGFGVIAAKQFIPGIYTFSTPLPKLVILKSNITIEEPFNVSLIAVAKRVSSEEESVTRQIVTVNQCGLEGMIFRRAIM